MWKSGTVGNCGWMWKKERENCCFWGFFFFLPDGRGNGECGKAGPWATAGGCGRVQGLRAVRGGLPAESNRAGRAAESLRLSHGGLQRHGLHGLRNLLYGVPRAGGDYRLESCESSTRRGSRHGG